MNTQPKFWLVWSPDGKTPPSKQHPTHLEARNEAFRLSRLYPGLQFYVLKKKEVLCHQPFPEYLKEQTYVRPGLPKAFWDMMKDSGKTDGLTERQRAAKMVAPGTDTHSPVFVDRKLGTLDQVKQLLRDGRCMGVHYADKFTVYAINAEGLPQGACVDEIVKTIKLEDPQAIVIVFKNKMKDVSLTPPVDLAKFDQDVPNKIKHKLAPTLYPWHPLVKEVLKIIELERINGFENMTGAIVLKGRAVDHGCEPEARGVKVCGRPIIFAGDIKTPAERDPAKCDPHCVIKGPAKPGDCDGKGGCEVCQHDFKGLLGQNWQG